MRTPIDPLCRGANPTRPIRGIFGLAFDAGTPRASVRCFELFPIGLVSLGIGGFVDECGRDFFGVFVVVVDGDRIGYAGCHRD